jgi:hypothetical protein
MNNMSDEKSGLAVNKTSRRCGNIDGSEKNTKTNGDTVVLASLFNDSQCDGPMQSFSLMPPKENVMHQATNMYFALKHLGITSRDLARAAGLNEVHLCRVLKGRSPVITDSTRIKLAQGLQRLIRPGNLPL